MFYYGKIIFYQSGVTLKRKITFTKEKHYKY